MNSYRIDRELFEALLANAFTVQQSGLDRQSLASLVEIQQFIASEGFDFNEEMRMVVDRVLNVSKAGGVAIALLESGQLVYRVGVGSATKQIGRRAAAVLNASSSRGLRQEILRVEDASSSKRIEADICRQFGAMSLLMLPICENGVLRGILQLSFDDAHSFPDHEIRAYRLMAGALEEGILRREQQAEKPETRNLVGQACDVEATSDSGCQSGDEPVTSSMFSDSDAEQNMLQAHRPTNTGNDFASEHLQGSQVRPALAPQNRSLLAVLTEATGWRVSTSNTLLWCFRAAMGAAIVLGIMIWTSGDHHTITSAGHSTAPALRDNEEPARGTPPSAKQELNPRSGLRENVRNIPEFKHVQITADEVDDIAEDVTIRHFTAKSIQPQMQNVVKEVNLGDDVTVRYYANGAPAVLKPTNLGSERNMKLQQR